MKIPKIAEALGYLEDDLIVGAAVQKKVRGKSTWRKWGSLAACLAAVLAVAWIIPLFRSTGTTKYKDYTISGSETDVEWPWEYKILYERYPAVTFDGREYRTRAREITVDLLGEVLGTCMAEGYDIYQNKTHTERFEVRGIIGVSADRFVAVGASESFYVYMVDDSTKPATLGELLSDWGLAQNLKLSHFDKCEGFKEKGRFAVHDDAYIWQILSECRDSELYADIDSWERGGRNYLSFTATSAALGAYKKALYITEDGYLWTNIFDYAYIFFIGEDAAEKILHYSQSNSVQAESQPYENTIAGTLTEIGEGYILVDDTVLCVDEKDGTAYKIFTDDIRIRRCLECTNIAVGDTVVVKYQGSASESHEIVGAYSVYAGRLIDGDIAVPE